MSVDPEFVAKIAESNFAGYHKTKAGTIEVFHNPRHQKLVTEGPSPEPLEEGWYWWPCSPGCLPDADAIGPYETSEGALDEALINDD